MNRGLLSRLGPGLLVAATGVGAGDLITASMAGRDLGLVILWSAPAGALLKWVLNEGLARWQMATGTTLLEGWLTRLGRWVDVFFVPYFLLWSLFVGAAMIKACGVGAEALVPGLSAVAWGVLHSLAGLALVLRGGFALFEKVMSGTVGIMFVTVVATAVLSGPDLLAVLAGLTMPCIPDGGLPLTLGVLGGVGGTVTLLSYGYWIREEGRQGREGLAASRLDLGVGYAVTALFGAAMVVIGSDVPVAGKGNALVFGLADQLGDVLGPGGRLLFLVGFWAAVTSSLLGVWQGVPYLFADYWYTRRRQQPPGELTTTTPYRVYLVVLALVPISLQYWELQQVQLSYAVMGALFMPFLALTLLIMNNRREWVGEEYKSGPLINVILVATLLFFAYQGWLEAIEAMS